jgi:hypothetical protein
VYMYVCMHFFHQATRINFPAAAAGGDEGEGGMREEKPFAFFICEKAHAGEKREKEEEPLSLSLGALLEPESVCAALEISKIVFRAAEITFYLFSIPVCDIGAEGKEEREREACDGVQYFNTHIYNKPRERAVMLWALYRACPKTLTKFQFFSCTTNNLCHVIVVCWRSSLF